MTVGLFSSFNEEGTMCCSKPLLSTNSVTGIKSSPFLEVNVGCTQSLYALGERQFFLKCICFQQEWVESASVVFKVR